MRGPSVSERDPRRVEPGEATLGQRGAHAAHQASAYGGRVRRLSAGDVLGIRRPCDGNVVVTHPTPTSTRFFIPFVSAASEPSHSGRPHAFVARPYVRGSIDGWFAGLVAVVFVFALGAFLLMAASDNRRYI